MEIKDILDYVTGMPRNNNINVLKTMLETLVEEYSIGGIGSVGVEDILEYVELTPHNSNVNVLKIMLESLINPKPVVEGEAYAVFDSADGSLVFFRDEPGKYSEGQVEDTKTYYTGVETKTLGFGWRDNVEPTSVRFDDEITPISTLDWFRSFSGLTSIIGLDKLNTSNVTNMSGMFKGCTSLISLDLSNFNTSNVTSVSNMFGNCNSLTSLNLSGFDTSSVTSMDYMFASCPKLTTDITINDISKYSADMFINAATISPAQIILYSEGSVTSADIDAFIASVKAKSPDSNIVNGMSGYPYTIATIGAFASHSASRPAELTVSQNPKNNREIGTATFRNFYDPEHGNVDECDTTAYLTLLGEKFRLSAGIPFTGHETEEGEIEYYPLYVEFSPEDISNLDFWYSEEFSNSFSWGSVEITMERER